MDWIKDVTALIKTFNRPKSLQLLVSSIKYYFPELKIVIVDDGTKTISCNFGSNVFYYHTDHDIGLSAGRNLGIEKIRTKYVLLLDDDFLFTGKTKIQRMYEILESTEFSIVGGALLDNGYVTRRFHGCFGGGDGILHLQIESNKGHMQGYPVYDFVLNFFMGRMDHIKTVLWDKDLKLGEHEDFFLRFGKRGYKTTSLPDVFADHYPIVEGKYKEKRDRIEEYHQLFFLKSGYQGLRFLRKTPWYHPSFRAIVANPIRALRNVDSYWNFLMSFRRRKKVRTFLSELR